MRITANSVAANTYGNLQASLARSEKLQEQLSSGKQLSRPSDGPGQTAQALSLRSSLRTTEQYVRNADNGLAWLGTADAALQDASTQLRRVRELAVMGASTGSASATSNAALAVEVRSIRDSLVGIANTSYLGRPVFGGTGEGAQAYAAAPPPVAYVGDDGEVLRRIGPNAQVRVDVSGPDVFGSSPASVFDVLDKLALDLENNNQPELTADLGLIDTAMSAVLTGLADVGARVNRTESMRQLGTDQALRLRSDLAEIEDIDLPGTIVALKLQETAYQAALSATARVIQPSLLDFLR